MKILYIKFKNINSLAGINEIDFTDPKFADEGLFAITGKTGAGKSSILDAISLALFGKTPRVEITAQNNDVLTRGMNDCFSEIVFEVGGKKWKSAWKQERNRNGNLKPVNRQIADFADKIVADQVRSCDGKIVEILGLSFEQFTKVILLAQGNFTAFLQADNKDKGELLEQITGTEIYGEISRKVYERYKAEKEKLDKILFELGAIKIHSEDEINVIKDEIIEFEKKKQQIDIELQRIETAKKWLIDLENIQKQIADTTAKLPELHGKVEAAKSSLLQKEISLQNAKNEKEKTDIILVKVRELDINITNKTKLLHPILQSIKELTDKNSELSQSLVRQNEHLEKSKKTLTDIKNWAAKNEKYETLVGQYIAIENQNSQVQSLFFDLNKSRKEFETTKKELTGKITILQKSYNSFVEKETALNMKTQELENKKTALENTLSGYELTYYLNEKERITSFGTQLTNLIEVETAISNYQTEIAKYAEIILMSENTEKDLSIKISNDKTNIQTIDQFIALLEENIKFARTIQSLDEHRKMLEDGKPCPLCGASEHPYATGNIPQTSEKEKELKKLKQQFQTISTSIQLAEKALTKVISDKDHAFKNKEKVEQSLSLNNEKRITVLNEITLLQPDFSILETEKNGTLLKELRNKKMSEYERVNSIIIKATDYEKLLKKIQNEEIPTLQKTKEDAEKIKTNAETEKKLAEQQLETKQKILIEAENKHKDKHEELQKIFEKYGVENIIILKKCLDEWNAKTAKILSLSEQISECEKALILTNSQINNNIQLLENKNTEKQNITTEKQTVLAERTKLFGDKNVSEEEQRLKNLLEKADQIKTNAEKAKITAETELAKFQAVISEKEKELAEKQDQKITVKLFEELQTEFDEKKPQCDLISQRIGANRQLLKDHEEKLKNNGAKLKEKEIQQQIYQHWGGLNELIGSADGKKYRNFAQALTFEHLIGLANRQLQMMTDRYLLKRVGDAVNPFELSVIDKFQNCEERTAKNLSGGEKFIASLSLALGLANMASKNMPIDTMFIDEGFGTLDSDYLDTALSALSNLRSEGKIIGVISHLAELKERIATHIEVTQIGNGHSRIKIQ